MLKKVFNYWFPPLIWTLVIFTFSSFSTPSTSVIYWQDFIVKKTAHMLEYGIFALLLYRALRAYEMDKTKAVILSILFAGIYGLTDEFHQSFTPGREPRIRDVAFDTIGASLSMLLIWKKF